MPPRFVTKTLFTAQAVAQGTTANSAAVQITPLDNLALWLKWTQATGTAGSMSFGFQGSRDGTTFYDIFALYKDAANSLEVNLSWALAYNNTSYATGKLIMLDTLGDKVNFLMSNDILRAAPFIRFQFAAGASAGNATVDAELWSASNQAY